MTESKDRVAHFVDRIRRHPILAALLLTCIAVIGLAQFTDAVDRLIEFVEKRILGHEDQAAPVADGSSLNVRPFPPTPSPFAEPASPESWYEEAKYYRREDTEARKSTAPSGLDHLTLVRHYVSNHQDHDAGFGPGWHHSFEHRIEVDKSTICRILYFDNSGRRITFKPRAESCAAYVTRISKHLPDVRSDTPLGEIIGRRTASAFEQPLLSLDYLGVDLRVATMQLYTRGMSVAFSHAMRYFFDRDGLLSEIETPLAGRLVVARDLRTGRLEGVSTSDRRLYVDIRYNADGRVEEVAYEDDTSYAFVYDAHGRLSEVRFEDRAVVRYDYDDANRLSRVEETKGRGRSEALVVAYDSHGWRKQVARGNTSVAWDIRHDKQFPTVERVHWTGDRRDAATRYKFDLRRYVLTMTDLLTGSETVYELTQCGCNPHSVITADGKTTYEYDDLGNVKKILPPSGEALEYSWHPTFNKVTKFVRKNGAGDSLREISYDYDDLGQMRRAQAKGGEAVLIRYNERNLVEEIEVEGAPGRASVMRFRYNIAGKPTQVDAPGLGTAQIHYDGGKVTRVSGTNYREVLGFAQERMRLLEAGIKPPIDRRYTSINDAL